MDVTLLSKRQKQKAAGVFYRAFFNYPQMTHYFPSAAVRERYLQWYLGCVIEHALRYGEVYTNPEISGFVCWLPPKNTSPTLLQYARSGFLLAPLRFGIKEYQHVFACEDYTSAVHKKLMPLPHYYVWGLAVEPDRQGQGIGRQLLQPGLEKAQQQGLPVYLETHDPQNIPFYQKLGFHLICEERVPEQNLPFWCFSREPSPLSV